ncbi:hypothetical protein DPMN_006152 [Dreissena polymorpha]|uniref:Uncharacterized protein n=1 Tax=Dreissena polymorpha TaxID=45954 RepID=A0A9D4MUW7_DREPO|nr:hypothetical protein DPMN_006152 [Dreissena polymorpha]
MEQTQCARLRQMVMLFLKQFVHKLSLHHYKWDLLFKSIIYNVRRLLLNAADFVEPNVIGSDIDLLEMHVIPAANRVDHNTIAIDGKCTFRGMDVKKSFTPASRMIFLIPQNRLKSLTLEIRQKCYLGVPVGKACLY